MSLVDNERAKLTATYVNGIAIALAAVGGIAPWIALSLQGPEPRATEVAIVSALCFSLSCALHLVSRWVLGRLK